MIRLYICLMWVLDFFFLSLYRIKQNKTTKQTQIFSSCGFGPECVMRLKNSQPERLTKPVPNSQLAWRALQRGACTLLLDECSRTQAARTCHRRVPLKLSSQRQEWQNTRGNNPPWGQTRAARTPEDRMPTWKRWQVYTLNTVQHTEKDTMKKRIGRSGREP